MNKKLSEFYGSHILRELVWQDRVISFYDPSTGLPESPSLKDRYIAENTANGWIEGYIYEYMGDKWFSSEPLIGFVTYVIDQDATYYYDGSIWEKWIDVATSSDVGLIKPGEGLEVEADGTLNVVSLAGGPASYVSIQTDIIDATINHNLNVPYVYIQVYDDNNEIIKPDTVKIVDDNNVRLIFSEPTSFLCIITEAGINNDSILSFINFKGRWSDLTGELYRPATVFHNDQFWILLDDLADVTVEEPTLTSSSWRPPQGASTGNFFSETYTTDQVTINHGLNSAGIIVQVRNDSNKIIYPQDIEIIDNNNIQMTFANSTTFTVIIK